MQSYFRRIVEQGKHEHPVSVDVVYEDDNMTVHSIISRADALETAHESSRGILPNHRCYRVGGRIDDIAKTDRLRPKYGDRILHCIYPASWMTPTRPHFENECFEFGPAGHLGHGSDFGEAENRIPLSGYRFRQQRPELEKFFHLEETALARNGMPLLGVHVTPDQFPAAMADTLAKFEKRLDQSLGSSVAALQMVYTHHFMGVRLLDLDHDTINNNAVQKLSFMLADKLYLSHKELIPKLVDCVSSIDVMEFRQVRHEAVLSVLRPWFEHNSINRVLDKLIGDHARTYMTLQLSNVWEYVIDELEQSVYDSIEEHK